MGKTKKQKSTASTIPHREMMIRMNFLVQASRLAMEESMKIEKTVDQSMNSVASGSLSGMARFYAQNARDISKKMVIKMYSC